MRFPAILNEADAVFGRVSVVQMASDVSAKERAEGRRKTRDDRQRAKNLFQRQRHPDDAGRTHKQFLWRAAQPLRGFSNRAHSRRVAGFAGGAVRVASIYNHGAHTAFRRTHIFLGNEHRGGNHEVCVKTAAAEACHITRKNCQVERAGFLQTAGGRAKAKSARQGSFRKCVLYQRNVRVTSAPAPEGTSDPPQQRRGIIAVSLLAYIHGLAPVLVAFLLRRRSKFAMASLTLSGAVPPGTFFAAQRRFHAEAFGEIGFKRGRDVLENFERQRRPRNILFLGFAQHFADDVVRLAERNSFVHKIVRRFGREQTRDWTLRFSIGRR